MKYIIKGKLVTAVPAHQVTGFLLGSFADSRFRVYDEEDKRKFVDYEIYHSDLEVRILDNGYFYYDDDGNAWLDHSSETLGLTPG